MARVLKILITLIIINLAIVAVLGSSHHRVNKLIVSKETANGMWIEGSGKVLCNSWEYFSFDVNHYDVDRLLLSFEFTHLTDNDSKQLKMYLKFNEIGNDTNYDGMTKSPTEDLTMTFIPTNSTGYISVTALPLTGECIEGEEVGFKFEIKISFSQLPIWAILLIILGVLTIFGIVFTLVRLLCVIDRKKRSSYTSI